MTSPCSAYPSNRSSARSERKSPRRRVAARLPPFRACAASGQASTPTSTSTSTSASASASTSSSSPSPASDSSKNGNHLNPDDVMHDSWRIYSKPGNLCVICFGKGHSKCLYCFGRGTIRVGPEAARDTLTCPQCNGTAEEFCIRCDGTGIRPNFRYVVDSDDPVRNLTNEEVRNLPSQAEVEAQEEVQANAQQQQQQQHQQQHQQHEADSVISEDSQ